MSNKTNKRMAKTFWKTGSGKLMRRRAGQAHFNSRERGNVSKNKRRDVTVAKTEQKLKFSIH
jgi:ribosomal protein L35